MNLNHFLRAERFPSFCIFIIVMLFFLPSLFNGFVDWDDMPLILMNSDFRGLGLKQLKWMFTTFLMSHYQPFTWLSFCVDWLCWGLNPFGYHLTNIILHSLSAALLYEISFMLFSRGNLEKKYVTAGSVAAALFFALHPLRAESVSWITERRDVLSAALFFLAIFLYIRGFHYYKTVHCSDSAQNNCVNTGSLPSPSSCSSISKADLVICFAVYVAACLSKSMAVTLPAVLLLLDFYPLRRITLKNLTDPAARTVLAEKIPFFVFAAVLSVFYYFVVGKAIDVPYIDSYMPSFQKAVYAYWFYIVKMIFPYGLSPVYTPPENGYFLYNIAGGLMLVMLALLAWRLRYRFPSLITSLLYYAGTLFPVCGLLNGAPVPAADRYTYIPSAGPALFAGYVFAYLLSGNKSFVLNNNARLRRILTVLTTVFLIVIFSAGIRQQFFWKGSTSVWQRVASVQPRSAIAWNNLASLAFAKGEKEKAEKFMQKALSLAPEDFNIHFYCGNLYRLLNRNGDALSEYSRVTELAPSYYEAYIRKAEMESATGLVAEAVKTLRKATEIRPQYPQAWYNLAEMELSSGDYVQAEYSLKELLKIHEETEDIMLMLSVSAAGQGRYYEAAEYCRRALKIRPDYTEAAEFLHRLENTIHTVQK